IGWTWLASSQWGGGANVEAKLLQLTHAFETWGCRRVELKTDSLNERSRRAIEALGAGFEGIHRKHMLVRGGENRDTAWYAIFDDDWPDVRSRLRRRLRGSGPRYAVHEPGIRKELEQMIERMQVIGAGRVGSAISARLAERGL